MALLVWVHNGNVLSRTVNDPPSSGDEATASSPPDRLLSIAEQMDRNSNWLKDHELSLAHLGARVRRLEAGPQSPPTTAPSMTPSQEAPWDAEPCPICQLDQHSGPHKHPMAPVQDSDSPPESTDHVIPSSSPSGQLTTQTCLVEPGCACALLSHKPPTTLWQSMQIQGKWERVLRVGCPHCDALWAFVQIVARPVPASPSEST